MQTPKETSHQIDTNRYTFSLSDIDVKNPVFLCFFIIFLSFVMGRSYYSSMVS